MNDTLKALIGLLDTGKPELQVAAAQVLGELRVREPAIVRSLAHAVKRSPVLGRFCLEALAKIQGPEAIQVLAAMTGETETLAEHAGHLLSELGVAVNGPLAALFGEAQADQRARILAILGRHLDKEAMPVFVQALLTPETVAAAARTLISAPLNPALLKQLRDGLHKHLAGPLPEVCVVHALQVLAAVDASGSRTQLIAYTDRRHAPAVRSAAFIALRGAPLTATQIREWLDVLEDPEQRDVHDAVRNLLEQLPEVPEGMVVVLKRLLTARQPEQRLFAEIGRAHV